MSRQWASKRRGIKGVALVNSGHLTLLQFRHSQAYSVLQLPLIAQCLLSVVRSTAGEKTDVIQLGLELEVGT